MKQSEGNRIVFIITLILFFLFNYFYFDVLNYGLPYFLNADEGASIKSSLFYYGFFSKANQNIVEPIYAPFFNFLLSGTFLFIKNIFIFKISIGDLKDFIYFNPHILVENLRMASLVTSSLSLFVFTIILKKLKINYLLSILVILSFITSYFFLDLSIVVGKNSYLLFFFLLQYYFFLKYIIKISKFNLKSYLFFSITASIGWGINYWCATPSLYSILILHFLKYRFSNFKYLIYSGLTFFTLGILLNFIISSDNIFSHFYDPSFLENYESSNRFLVFLADLKDSINIFIIFEKFIFFGLIASSIFLKHLNLIQKKIYFSTIFFCIEPAFLFAIADYSDAQLRYFGSAIGLLHILFALILTQKFKNSKFTEKVFLSIVIIIFFSFSEYNKISNILISKQILSNKYNQYEAIDDYKNKNSLFIVHNMLIRENLESLKLYKSLLNKNIIKLNPAADGKNSFEEIEKKITSYVNLSESNLSIVNKNINTFGGEFLIINENLFLFEIMNKFDFVIIHENDSYMQNIFNEKFKLHKVYKSENLIYARNLTTRLRNKQKNEELNKIGPTLYVYKIK